MLRERRLQRIAEQVEQCGVLPPVVVDELLGIPHRVEQRVGERCRTSQEHAGIEHRCIGIALLGVPCEPDIGCIVGHPGRFEQIGPQIDDECIGIDPEHERIPSE